MKGLTDIQLRIRRDRLSDYLLTNPESPAASAKLLEVIKEIKRRKRIRKK
jgi:hypothetical protein